MSTAAFLHCISDSQSGLTDPIKLHVCYFVFTHIISTHIRYIDVALPESQRRGPLVSIILHSMIVLVFTILAHAFFCHHNRGL